MFVCKTDILKMFVHRRCSPDQEIFNRRLADVRGNHRHLIDVYLTSDRRRPIDVLQMSKQHCLILLITEEVISDGAEPAGSARSAFHL